MVRRFPGFSALPFLLLSLAAACSLPAASIPQTSDTTPRERALVAQSLVGEKLWTWQRRLNLQNWHITVIFAQPTELKPRTLGNIHWDADKHSAVIRVLAADHYKLPFREMLEDMEFTVVHELIHLELASLPKSEASRSAEEFAVNQMADALLKLDRDRVTAAQAACQK
jgi:hypothetical protein